MLRIKSVEHVDIPLISDFCRDKILGTKVMCQINAYGLERDFLSAWKCTDTDRLYGIICKFEDSITFVGCCGKYTEDIKLFLEMIGYRQLCCAYSAAEELGYTDCVTKKGYVYSGKYEGDTFGDLTEEYYKDCYSLISEHISGSFENTAEAYLSFLSDFTYRKRRGLARIKGCTEDGELYSCALTSAETKNSAMISGVVCSPKGRNNGVGKKTVLSVAMELHTENKKAYLIALNESAEGFYEHIGFEFKENISFIERK
ncbi:MAG: GNAT family N-acetyltransferase [Clostridia bacterium]|nr:GNAT family N-acetyltransferase [Clostridia bacterium]